MLGDPRLSELVVAKGMPQELVDELIGEANRHGGLDNITAVVVRLDSVAGPGGGAGGGGDRGQPTPPGAPPNAPAPPLTAGPIPRPRPPTPRPCRPGAPPPPAPAP